MQYLKFTHIATANGLGFPPVVGLIFEWARESHYPTNIPQLFGTCPDTSTISLPGVLASFSQYDYVNMKADELAARTRLSNDSSDISSAKAHAKLAALKNMSPAQVQAWVTTNVTTLAQAQDAIATLAIAVSILARKL